MSDNMSDNTEQYRTPLRQELGNSAESTQIILRVYRVRFNQTLSSNKGVTPSQTGATGVPPWQITSPACRGSILLRNTGVLATKRRSPDRFASYPNAYTRSGGVQNCDMVPFPSLNLLRGVSFASASISSILLALETVGWSRLALYSFYWT